MIVIIFLRLIDAVRKAISIVKENGGTISILISVLKYPAKCRRPFEYILDIRISSCQAMANWIISRLAQPAMKSRKLSQGFTSVELPTSSLNVAPVSQLSFKDETYRSCGLLLVEGIDPTGLAIALAQPLLACFLVIFRTRCCAHANAAGSLVISARTDGSWHVHAGTN